MEDLIESGSAEDLQKEGPKKRASRGTLEKKEEDGQMVVLGLAYICSQFFILL